MKKAISILEFISCLTILLVVAAAFCIAISIDIECSFKYITTGADFQSNVVKFVLKNQHSDTIFIACVCSCAASIFLFIILPCQSAQEKCTTASQNVKSRRGDMSKKVKQKCGEHKNQAKHEKFKDVFQNIFKYCALMVIITMLYFVAHLVYQGLIKGTPLRNMEFQLLADVVGWVNAHMICRIFVVFTIHCAFIGFCYFESCLEKKYDSETSLLFDAMISGDEAQIAEHLNKLGINTEQYNRAINKAPQLPE